MLKKRKIELATALQTLIFHGLVIRFPWNILLRHWKQGETTSCFWWKYRTQEFGHIFSAQLICPHRMPMEFWVPKNWEFWPMKNLFDFYGSREPWTTLEKNESSRERSLVYANQWWNIQHSFNLDPSTSVCSKCTFVYSFDHITAWLFWTLAINSLIIPFFKGLPCL